MQKGPGSTVVARQELEYFGNDDPKTLRHHLGATNRLFTYGFDLRHQLTSVATDTSSYFSAAYQYGAAGRFTRATHDRTITPVPEGSDLKVRDVNYVYGGTDPEQVTALTDATSGAAIATYTYDAAGNQVKRCNGATTTPVCLGESTEYVYDGRSQLRRATKKLNGVVQGSEEYWYENTGQRLTIVKRDAAGAKTEMVWVRLFRDALDGRSFDHLTSLRCGRDGGSGFGIARSA